MQNMSMETVTPWSNFKIVHDLFGGKLTSGEKKEPPKINNP